MKKWNCGNKDPVESLRKYLIENTLQVPKSGRNPSARVKEAVEASVKFAGRKSIPPLESAFEGIYAD